MHIEPVEIYADTTNAAILRRPERNFPGVLIQGDTLYVMCQAADFVCKSAQSELDEEIYQELNELRNRLWGFLIHYKSILLEHELPLPFSEHPRSSTPG